MDDEVRIDIDTENPPIQLDVLESLQKEVPWALEKNFHCVAPLFLKCDGKIAKYDMSGLHIWRVK